MGVSIKVKPYKGIDFEKVAQDTIFKAAVNGMNGWKDNLNSGMGATGSHGGPYRDRGEAVNDVTMQPQEHGSMEYIVGGDVIQLAIAEFGRVPSPGKPPPFEAIAGWVVRKGIAKRTDEFFYPIVDKIRWNIANHGLEGFAPGQKAAADSNRRVKKEFAAETEKAIQAAKV